jgi:hypothetical protein
MGDDAILGIEENGLGQLSERSGLCSWPKRPHAGDLDGRADVQLLTQALDQRQQSRCDEGKLKGRP